MRFERESVGVVCPPALPSHRPVEGGQSSAAQVLAWTFIASSRRSRCGRTVWCARPGRSRRLRRRSGLFADSLLPTDEVAIEATCNTHAIVRLIAPRVARVVISNPMKTRAIAEAKVKTDKVDAEVLAQLLAADYLPAVWIAG